MKQLLEWIIMMLMSLLSVSCQSDTHEYLPTKKYPTVDAMTGAAIRESFDTCVTEKTDYKTTEKIRH